MLNLAPLESILKKEGNKLILELQALMVSTGANASGTTSKSLEVVTRNTSTSIGMSVTGGIGWAFVEQGRGKTVKSGDGRLRGIIRQWIDDKGITPDNGMSKDSLAYVITRAIHNRGTLFNLLGYRREIYTSVITDEYIDTVVDKLGTEVQAQVSSDIITKFIL